MNSADPTETPLSIHLDAARGTLLARHPAAASTAAAPPRAIDCLSAVDDGSFVVGMLLARSGALPSIEQFSEKLAVLRSGLTNRYDMLAKEMAGAETPDAGLDAGLFLSRTIFHVAEFEPLDSEPFVVAACCACLGRRPDPFLLGHYRDRLDRRELDRTQILGQLLNSEEARYRGVKRIIVGLGESGDLDRTLVAALAAAQHRIRQLEYYTSLLQLERARRIQHPHPNPPPQAGGGENGKPSPARGGGLGGGAASAVQPP